jgi:tetratricopeptide (TPR) repeat protein
MRFLGAGLLSVVAVGALAWSWLFLDSDRRIPLSFDDLQAGRVDEAREHFERAIGFRDEYEFREVYAEGLGLVGIPRGERGRHLIDEMLRVNGYLETFPENTAIAVEAELLHYWGRVDRQGDLWALARFERLMDLDPNNPLVEVQASEVLLDLSRPAQAVALLEPLVQDLTGRAPDFWSMLAIARLRAGDRVGASAALDEAARTVRSPECRYLIARQIVQAPDTEEPLLAFACPGGLVDWYQDQKAELDETGGGPN